MDTGRADHNGDKRAAHGYEARREAFDGGVR